MSFKLCIYMHMQNHCNFFNLCAFSLILIPFNILTYFFSTSLPYCPLQNPFFSLAVSFHFSPTYTGCCSTLQQDAWLVSPVVLQRISLVLITLQPVRWGLCAGFNTVALVYCSSLFCCDKAEDHLRGILRQHHLQRFQLLLFLSLFLDLPFHLVVPLFDLPDPFQINSLSRIILYLLVTVLLCL